MDYPALGERLTANVWRRGRAARLALSALVGRNAEIARQAAVKIGKLDFAPGNVRGRRNLMIRRAYAATTYGREGCAKSDHAGAGANGRTPTCVDNRPQAEVAGLGLVGLPRNPIVLDADRLAFGGL